MKGTFLHLRCRKVPFIEHQRGLRLAGVSTEIHRVSHSNAQ